MVGQIERLYAALITAWNNCDAPGMAACYAEDGNQVGFDGSMANSKREIEERLAPTFKDHPTPQFVTIVQDIREIAPGVSLLRAVAGMVPPGESEIIPDRNAVQSLVASQDHEGDWKVQLFQNTPASFDGRPHAQRQLTRELQSAFDARSD